MEKIIGLDVKARTKLANFMFRKYLKMGLLDSEGSPVYSVMVTDIGSVLPIFKKKTYLFYLGFHRDSNFASFSDVNENHHDFVNHD